MFEPPIHWHYAGKLRQRLLDKASDAFVGQLIDALRASREPTVLLSPVPLTSELAVTIKQAFERAGMAVYAVAEHESFEHQLSTAYDPAKAEWRLVKVTMNFGPRKDVARADPAPAAISPQAVPRRPWWRFGGWFASRKQQTREPSLQSPAASPRTFAGLRRQFRSMDAGVIIVSPPGGGWIRAQEDFDRAFDLVPVIEAARQSDPTIHALPIPGLDRDELLRLVVTLPSQILDGSSEHEMGLERAIERDAASSPEGFLAQALWRALKAGYGPYRLSLAEFRERLAVLDPEIANAHPWQSLFDLWGEILYGLDSDREYSRRWLDKIEAHRAGLVSLDDIDDILLYEASIYCLHCEANRQFLSYPVVYHGTRWVQTRMALASAFGGRGSMEQAPGGLAWDN